MEKFKFLVDYNDKRSCAIVGRHMKEVGLKYIRQIKGRLSSDHSGIKELPSLCSARREAMKLHKRYFDEIHQVTVL